MKRLLWFGIAVSLLVNLVLASTLAVRDVQRAVYYAWLPWARAQAAWVVDLPARGWRAVTGRAAVAYDFGWRPSPDDFRYDARAPRQVEYVPVPGAAPGGIGATERSEFAEGTAFPPERLARELLRLEGTDRGAYLRGILDRLAVAALPTDAAKVERIVTFVQSAVRHDPIVSPPSYDPVLVLETHKGRCGQANYQVLPALLNLAGFRTRRVKLNAHAGLEVWHDGAWHYYDADMLKDGLVLRRPDGSVPDAAWLTIAPNYYMVDAYPAWSEAYAYGGAPVNTAGKRITGVTGIANPEDLGYPSSRFGAPLAHAPSPPELAAEEMHTTRPAVTLAWGGSYDRDHDFLHYRLEVGTAPGKADVVTAETKKAIATVTLPAPGEYFYRVRAVDRHVEREPRTVYVPSPEGRIVYRAQGPGGGAGETARGAWPVPRGIAREPRRILDAPSFADGGLGGFERVAAEASDEAELFNVDWFGGRAVKMVDLSDSTSTRASGHRVADRPATFRRWIAPAAPPAAMVVSFDLYLERRGSGGARPFSVVQLGPDLTGGERLALVIDPEQDRLHVVYGAPEPSRAGLRPRYWVFYRSEWKHALNGPEVFWLEPGRPSVSGRSLAVLPIQGRNAWRFDIVTEPERLSVFANGDPAGTAVGRARLRWISLQSNPTDEVVYVFGALRAWQ